MLCLTRKESESIVLIHDGKVLGEIQIIWVGPGQTGQGKIKIGLDMDKDVIIWRKEVWENMKNRFAAREAGMKNNG